jgi:hypothetical protein
MHNPHDGGEGDVHLLRQEQRFPRHDHLWRWESYQGQRFGKIAITTAHSISNVFLVESLGYNLLSISQLCHMGYNCLFTNIDVSVFRRSDGSLAFKGVLDDKLYLVDFTKENVDLDACLITKTNMGYMWHHCLAHVGMKNLHKLLKGEHMLGLIDVSFEKDRPCATCQAGKQVGTTHESKNVMTTSRSLNSSIWISSGPLFILASGEVSMVLLLLMIFPASLGYSFCRIIQKPKVL